MEINSRFTYLGELILEFLKGLEELCLVRLAELVGFDLGHFAIDWSVWKINRLPIPGFWLWPAQDSNNNETARETQPRKKSTIDV